MEALDGIKVVQVLGSLPHNYCTLLLADLGADVIKVQPLLPRRETSGHAMRDESKATVDVLNRNKKSIALDLKQETGKAILYKLAETADVVLDGMRPGKAKSLAIDYDALRPSNPDLIYCNISAYGQDGPYAGYSAHDHSCAAVAGALALTGNDPLGEPVIPSIPVGDMGSGTMAAFAIMAALQARDKHGVGQFIDISMTDLYVSFLSMYFGPYFTSGASPRRGGPGSISSFKPWIGVYRCRDNKYVMMNNFEAPLWEALCRKIGKPEWGKQSFTLNKRKAEESITAELTRIIATKSRDEWFHLLAPEGVAIAPVNDFDEMLSDPQVVHRGMIFEVDGPGGKTRQIRHPVIFSKTPAKFKHLEPRRGEHTEEVLRELGYDSNDIVGLRQSNVIN